MPNVKRYPVRRGGRRDLPRAAARRRSNHMTSSESHPCDLTTLPGRLGAPSGTVIASMETTPDHNTLLLAANQMAPDVATAAVEALRSGEVTAYIVSGKLAAGKDAIAAAIAERLVTDGHIDEAPIGLQTSSPMRAELQQLFTDGAEAATLAALEATFRGPRNLPGAAAAHLAQVIWPMTRDETPSAETRTDTNRHLLQYLADDGRRATNPDYWVYAMFPLALSALADGRSVFISGIRYPNEIAPAQRLGFATIRLGVSRSVQEARLRDRDGLAPNPALLDDPNECALDTFVGYTLHVGNDDGIDATVDTCVNTIVEHRKRLMSS